MSEFLLRFSSRNREKVVVSLSHDFTTKFNKPIRLSNDMKHEVAVRLIKMTYSWYNIRQSYGNNQIKYSKDNGTNWETITFVDGMYSYDDIDKYIKNYLKNKEHFTKGDKDSDDNEIEYGINLYFVLSTYRVLIELADNYQIDLTNSDFRKLIGFDSKIIKQTEYGTNLPYITRGVDVRLITDEKKLLKYTSKPTYVSSKIFNENLVAVHKIKETLTLNRSAYVGMCILDLSKTLMYDFHYNYIKKKYGNKAKLLFTDTDSLTYEIEAEDVYQDFWNDKDKFDNSDYPISSPYFDKTNKNVIGKFKDEAAGVPICEFVGLR